MKEFDKAEVLAMDVLKELRPGQTILVSRVRGRMIMQSWLIPRQYVGDIPGDIPQGSEGFRSVAERIFQLSQETDDDHK